MGRADFGEGHAIPTLITDHAGIEPGSRFDLGITIEIEPGWHLYWNGLNDTGFPIDVKITLPEGFVATDSLQWPAPERHLSPGDILDHVYHDEVTLILPLRAPEDLDASRLTFHGEIQWLACKDVCLPGKAEVSLTLPVVEEAGPGRKHDLERLEQARSRLPGPLDPNTDLTVRLGPEVVTLQTPGARVLAFYPALDCAKLPHLIEDGRVEAERISLRRAPQENRTAEVLSGVLEIDRGAGGPRFYSVRLILP